MKKEDIRIKLALLRIHNGWDTVDAVYEWKKIKRKKVAELLAYLKTGAKTKCNNCNCASVKIHEETENHIKGICFKCNTPYFAVIAKEI